MSIKPQPTMLLKQPWHNLRELQGLQGVLAEWGSFPSSLLQITNELAPAMRCCKSGGCYMDVISNQDGQHVGICTSEPKRCDRRPLNKTDIIIHRLNTTELLKKVAEVTRCQVQTEAMQGMGHTWRIGSITPQGEERFPVFLSLGARPSDLDRVVTQLAFQQKPYLLAGILGSLFSHSSLDAAIKAKAKLVGLDDVLVITESGEVETKDSAAGIISAWVEGLIPKSKKPGSEYFYPTPPNANWSEIVMEFTADDVINITCRDKFDRLEPEQFRMKDLRTKRPTAQWAIFKALAMAGEFKWVFPFQKIPPAMAFAVIGAGGNGKRRAYP